MFIKRILSVIIFAEGGGGWLLFGGLYFRNFSVLEDYFGNVAIPSLVPF